ncbi:MAG: hypothetical protein U1E62_23645 [Alsobacter sp.]
MPGDLAALVRRLEAAHQPSPYLDAALLAAFDVADGDLRPTHSVNDACRLIDRILPGLLWSISGIIGEARARLMIFEGMPRIYTGVASTPALALLAAFVRFQVDAPDTPPPAL